MASSKACPGGAGHALQPLEVDRVQQHLGRIHELWDELSGYGVGQADAALRCCMERIGSWLDAQDAFWIGAVHLLKCPEQNARGSLSGWRIRAIEHFHPHFHDARHNEKVVKGGQIEEQGATNVTLAAGAGRFRAYTLQAGELVDIDAFRETAHYDFYYRRWGIRDRIWVAAPVNADTESYFCFDRIGEQARLFDDGELALAARTRRVHAARHQVVPSPVDAEPRPGALGGAAHARRTARHSWPAVGRDGARDRGKDGTLTGNGASVCLPHLQEIRGAGPARIHRLVVVRPWWLKLHVPILDAAQPRPRIRDGL